MISLSIRCPRCQRDVRVDENQTGREIRCEHCEQVFLAPPEMHPAYAKTVASAVTMCRKCGEPVHNKAFYLITYLFKAGSCSIGPEPPHFVYLTGNAGANSQVYGENFRDPDGYRALLTGEFSESVARRYLAIFRRSYLRQYGQDLGNELSLFTIPPDLCLSCGQDDLRTTLSTLSARYQPVGENKLTAFDDNEEEEAVDPMAWWEWTLLCLFAAVIIGAIIRMLW